MKYILVFGALTATLLFSCNKEDEHHPCWDKDLVHQGVCTQDCPGVCGCDGNEYCNECEANRRGISVVSNGACPN